MAKPNIKKVKFEISLTVTDPVAMRAEALRYWLAGGGREEDFVENERLEDKIEETPIGAWVEALFDHPREFGPGFEEQWYRVDSSKFYEPPRLPKGFDPATSITGAQIAKLMTVALESEYWNDLKPELPKAFRFLVTNAIWYSDPALFETQHPWYFEITTREYAGYNAEKKKVVYKYVNHKIGRADIVEALTHLAKHRPRRILEIMNGNSDVDLADIFLQTLLFGDFCYN